MDPKTKALAEIQRRREKLARMEEFLESLDSCDLVSLREVLFGQDETPSQNEDVIHLGASLKTIEKSTRQHASPGALEVAVHSALSRMDIITAPAIVEQLVSSGYVFAAQSPLAAVNQVMRKFRENGILLEVEPGSGRRATKYKKASQTSQNADDKANFRLAS